MVLRTYTERPAAKPGSAATFLYRTCEFVARPDAVGACESAIAELIDHAERVEEGTCFVASFRDADDPFHYMVTAVFMDELAERQHDASAVCERFRTAIRDAAPGGVTVRSWEAGAGL
jgi:quinol monooxygenase YgiN